MGVTFLTGCEADPYVAVPKWTLTGFDGKSQAITIPQHLDDFLAKRRSIYFLDADVPLSRALRGRALTLSWAGTEALATLVVDNEEILPLNLLPFDRVRPSTKLLVFRIPDSQTDRDTLHLRLQVRHVGTWTAKIEVVPRLAASPYGERQLRIASYVNYTIEAALAAIFVLLGLAAGASFLLDRRRAMDGWYALMNLSLGFLLVQAVGLTQLVDSGDIPHVAFIALPLICFSGVHFTITQMGGKPSRPILIAFLVLSAGALAAGWPPFTPFRRYAVMMGVQLGLFGFHQFRTIAPLAREGIHRSQVVGNLAATSLLGLGVFLEMRPHLFDAFPPIAFLCAAVLGVIVLRKHARDSQTLNAALNERVLTLEERSQEVRHLNEELRLQIHQRSARIANVLARVGGLSSGSNRPLTIGALVGDGYRVLKALGEGGMGTVYEVERVRDGRHFALKTLVRHTDDGLARLAREAEAATVIVHPNVVRVLDVDVDASGLLFIVMELVTGEPLSFSEARSSDPQFVREVVRQIAAGLAALHEAGIVHRDLKPANVLLESRDDQSIRVKIADFGIARVAPPETGNPMRAAVGGDLLTGDFISFVCSNSSIYDDDSVKHSLAEGALTRTGHMLGTPSYMAPELAVGVKNAAPSCDIWSLGVLAYEIVCGRLPFTVPPVYLAGHPDGWPPIELSPLTAPLRDVIDRCLNPNPMHRPTAVEVVAALAGQ